MKSSTVSFQHIFFKIYAILIFLFLNSASLANSNNNNLIENGLKQNNLNHDESQINQPVPLELAKFAAEYYAKQFYSQMAFYDSTTLYDINGLPSVYCIILIDPIIAKTPQNLIINQIHSNYTKIKKLKTAIKEIDNEDISGKRKAERIAELNKQIQESNKIMADVTHFATFYCGATEDHVPVIRSHRGLPEHLVALPSLEEEIGIKPALLQKKLGKLLYLGIFDIAYELAPTSDQSSTLQSQEISTGQNGFSDKSSFILVRGGKTLLGAEIRAGDRKKLQGLGLESNDDIALQNLQQEERKNIVQEKWQRLKLIYDEQK